MSQVLRIENADGSYSSVMTLADVAAVLGISRDYASLKVHRGQIPVPALRVGREPLWREEQILPMVGKAPRAVATSG